MCVWRPKCVSGADNSLTLSRMLFRVSSFTFVARNAQLLPDAFSRGALIPTCSPRSELAVTLVASRPEDAFIDLIANSILGVTMLSIAVKVALLILSSTVSTILFISLSILSLKHLSKVFTFAVFSLTAELLEIPTLKSRSLVPSLTAMLSCLSPTIMPIMVS